MRLIKAQTFIQTRRISFAEFYGDIPQYAILSHTWDGHQEVIFQECNLESSKSKTGYGKIRKTCELALSDGIDYVWVDTCCIDKSSSAELTEAINSMFLWYQKASVCYVYLVDKFEGSPLGDCRWFTRGWTLQELIAPRVMSFFNYSWDCIGSKNSLMAQLTTITPIDPNILSHDAPISSACIAKRLSWAAGRNTTRVEDIAYCLLGICDVHMPMLYGEGKTAFRRLQEEIIRTTYDLSLLAWTPPVSSDNSEKEYCGFLAESVNYFAPCSEMYSVTDSLLGEGDISVSNKGLRLMTRVHVLDYAHLGYRYVLRLDCTSPGVDGDFLTIPMRKVGPNTFVRARSLEEGNLDSFCLESTSLEENAFYTVTLLTTMPNPSIGSPLYAPRSSAIISHSRFTLVSIELPVDISILYTTETPAKFWDMQDHVFFGPQGSYKNWGAIILETDTLFICFWQKEDNDWTFNASLLDFREKEVQNLWKDLFISADQLCYQQPIVQYMLQNVENEMKSSIETRLKEDKITLSFKAWRADNQNLCSGPRWRVVFNRTSFTRESSPRPNVGL
ncbi:related to beta transducin-like protein [Fusarium torulosum]|uniref:Related to beta transducin-like protein n=1 Tax=Fusarium torulosum TaxID=33205 RepID=A0AAE8MKG7_9HYPO|nr:related to beta transducin-like protein [Fusarium torulosum]